MIIFPITILLILNFWFFKSVFWGVILGFFYFLFLSRKLAQKFTPKLNLLFSFLLVLSLTSFIGAGFYFLYQLNNAIIAIILLVLPALIYRHCESVSSRQSGTDEAIPRLTEKITGLLRRSLHSVAFTPRNDMGRLMANNNWPINWPFLRPKYKNLLIITYSFLAFILFKILFIFQTSEAIRSPWKVIPPEFFIYYFLATLALLIIIVNSTKKIYLSLISVHFLISSSIALIIYKLGYGFDQFIHQATEKIIIQQGVIYPKTIYYLGQYSLVTFLSKIFNINHIWIDKLLVTILFSVFLPFIIYISLKKLFPNNRATPVLPLLFLFFPISSFIVTTPQNLANLFILFIVFISLPFLAKKENWLLLIIILTLATLAIHPLAGIPALIFLIIILFDTYSLSPIIKYSFFVLGSTIIPLIFLINSYLFYFNI